MANIVERILKRHDAIQIAEQLQAALAEEAGRRHAFREWVDDSVKAEFINGETIYHSPAKQKHWATSGFLARLLSIYVDSRQLVLSGFSIPVRALFYADANMQTLQTLLSGK